MVSTQSSHTSPSKYRCSSPSKNLMSSFLTPWLCSLSYLSCGNVICGISYLCFFGCLSCGDVIYGTVAIYLTISTTSGTTLTTIGTINGSIMSLIIFRALKSMLSCFVFILELEAPPSSTLFFLLKALLVMHPQTP